MKYIIQLLGDFWAQIDRLGQPKCKLREALITHNYGPAVWMNTSTNPSCEKTTPVETPPGSSSQHAMITTTDHSVNDSSNDLNLDDLFDELNNNYIDWNVSNSAHTPTLADTPYQIAEVASALLTRIRQTDELNSDPLSSLLPLLQIWSSRYGLFASVDTVLEYEQNRFQDVEDDESQNFKAMLRRHLD